MSLPPTAHSGSPLPTAAIRLQRQPKPFQKFRQGEPKALGVALVMFAAIEFGFSFPLHMRATSYFTGLGVPWWLALLFVVSGSLSIVSENHPDKPRVTACLAVNILNAVATAIAIIIFSVDISFSSVRQNLSNHHQPSNVLQLGLKVFLTVVSIVGLILNLVLAAFCCRGLRYCSPGTSMPVVVVSGLRSDKPSCSSTLPGV